MKIETKFDVGDKIWTQIRTGKEWKPSEGSLEIGDIEIVVDRHGPAIAYYVDEFEWGLSETECFATLEESQDRCDLNSEV